MRLRAILGVLLGGLRGGKGTSQIGPPVNRCLQTEKRHPLGFASQFKHIRCSVSASSAYFFDFIFNFRYRFYNSPYAMMFIIFIFFCMIESGSVASAFDVLAGASSDMRPSRFLGGIPTSCTTLITHPPKELRLAPTNRPFLLLI